MLFYGTNSLTILLTHYYLTRRAFPFIVDYFNLSQYLYHPLVELLLFLITVAVMYPTVIVFNRFFYFILGKHRPVKTDITEPNG